MAEFIVHGVVQGQEVSATDKVAADFCGQYYIGTVKGGDGIRTDIKRLSNNRIAYSFLVFDEQNKPFISYIGRKGSYFGITFILKDQQIANPDDLFRVLLATYDRYVKNKIIQETPTTRKWLYPTLSDPEDTVACYVMKGFSQIMKQNPGLVKFQPLPPLQTPGRDY